VPGSDVARCFGLGIKGQDQKLKPASAGFLLVSKFLTAPVLPWVRQVQHPVFFGAVPRRSG
jgi:hypothetical protein